MSLTSGPSHNVEMYVLDSWPFLERELRGEPLPQVDRLIVQAASGHVRLLMSEMNLGEIFYLLAKRFGESDAEVLIASVRHLPIEVVPVTSDQLWAAARLKARTTLSYADCFCAALAMEHAAPVLTGDPDFLQLEKSGQIKLSWLGK